MWYICFFHTTTAPVVGFGFWIDGGTEAVWVCGGGAKGGSLEDIDACALLLGWLWGRLEDLLEPCADERDGYCSGH